jgi:DNA-binding transcriptional LysR family regulator
MPKVLIVEKRGSGILTIIQTATTRAYYPKSAMELRHLRYFLAVGEASNLSKAAAQLRVAQPALSRQVKDLEEEIGVDLLRRSPRGVTLTAEGRFFLEEVRELLECTGESVEKVRALARGECSELRVGYEPTLAVEILPPALAAFHKSVPCAMVSLHELSCDRLITGLRNGMLELAIMGQIAGGYTAGIEFESLRSYPLCVAVAPAHPFACLKSIPLEKVAAEPLIGLCRKGFPGYYRSLERIFAHIGAKPRIAVECDSRNSLLIKVEAGHGIAVFTPISKLVTGKSLLYRPVTGTTELASIGIARAIKGEVTTVGEKFCEVLRKTSDRATTAKAKPRRSSYTRPTRNGQKPLDAPGDHKTWLLTLPPSEPAANETTAYAQGSRIERNCSIY